MRLFNVIDNIKISVFYIMKMEHIKHKIEKLDNQLNSDEYDSNEKYIIKEEKLKKWGKRYNKDELFNMLFSNQMEDVNIDDKIVMLYDIDRYDVEQFNKSVKMLAVNDNASDDEDKNNDGVKVESFSSQLFDKIKSIVIKGLELLNQLINDKLDELIKLLGLEKRKNHLPNELSGGQQQRTSIGRALITNPTIILADEPTGNLDSKSSDEIVSLLKKTNKELKQTVIMITHNMEIAKIADRIIKLEDGKIVKED